MLTCTDCQVRADIMKRALSHLLDLIAKNAGVNGGVVIEKADKFMLGDE